MADTEDIKAEVSAEKAYAAAAEAVVDKDAPQAEVEVAAVEAEPVEFPAKPKRARKVRPEMVAAPPVENSPPAAVPVAAAPIKVPAQAAAKVAPKAPVAKVVRSGKKPAPKLAVKRSAAKPASKAPVRKIKPASPKPASVKAPVPVKGPVAAKAPVAAKPRAVAKTGASVPHFPFIAQLKDIPMDVTSSIKDAVSGAQAKAKEAFDKTSAAATEYGEFAKGNVEAFVEAGKILASGLQELGNGFIADSKVAFETASADVKALTAVKSPTDLFKLQTELLRRNFDTVIAYGTKTGEAVVKLTNEAVAPLSGRVTLAVEKVKKAA